MALGHLQAAYDEVHLNAPWGSHGAPSTSDGLPSLELGLVQDFVQGWMLEFAKCSYLDVSQLCVAQQGVAEQVAFLTTLFHFLTDPATCAVPKDLIEALPEPIP